jgi:hypothetical protein
MKFPPLPTLPTNRQTSLQDGTAAAGLPGNVPSFVYGVP